MRDLIKQFKLQLLEYHNDVVVNILTFKNLFDVRAIPALIASVFLALNFSEMLFSIFLFFYLLDYPTGILASIVELKKNPEKLAEKRERKTKGYWIESDRIIRGIVKAIIYIQVISLAYIATEMLNVKEIVVHSSISALTPIQILLIICIASEFVSNLENGKRAGFDLIGIITTGIKKIWNIRTLIKTGKDEANN